MPNPHIQVINSKFVGVHYKRGSDVGDTSVTLWLHWWGMNSKLPCLSPAARVDEQLPFKAHETRGRVTGGERQQRTLARLQAGHAEEREELGTGYKYVIYIFTHIIFDNDSFHLRTCTNQKPTCHHSQQNSPLHMRFALNVNHFSSSTSSCLFNSPCCFSSIRLAAKLLKKPAWKYSHTFKKRTLDYLS